jgi:hypothetical protein
VAEHGIIDALAGAGKNPSLVMLDGALVLQQALNEFLDFGAGLAEGFL